jgi:hypothetical protein
LGLRSSKGESVEINRKSLELFNALIKVFITYMN